MQEPARPNLGRHRAEISAPVEHGEALEVGEDGGHAVLGVSA